MNPLRRLSLIAAALAVGACSTLTGKKEPFTIYSPRYAPAAADAVKNDRVDWQLAIEAPLASDALDSTRMLVMASPGAFETYKGGRWSDTAPLLVRNLLIEAFQRSGRIAAVGATVSGLHADYTLGTDLYDFETEYRDGAPRAVVRLYAKLTSTREYRIVAARMFEADAPMSAATAAGAAAATEQALGELLPKIVGWALEEGTKASRAPAG